LNVMLSGILQVITFSCEVLEFVIFIVSILFLHFRAHVFNGFISKVFFAPSEKKFNSEREFEKSFENCFAFKTSIAKSPAS